MALVVTRRSQTTVTRLREAVAPALAAVAVVAVAAVVAVM